MIFSSSSWSDDSDQIVEIMSIIDRIKAIDSDEHSKWGIGTACIAINRIRSISFLDDQIAIVSLRGKKQLVLKLRKECRGISKTGFSYKARGGQLCPRFDRLTQAQSRMTCEIESIDPYFKLVENKV